MMAIIVIFKMIGMNKLNMPHEWKIRQCYDAKKQNGMRELYEKCFDITSGFNRQDPCWRKCFRYKQ